MELELKVEMEKLEGEVLEVLLEEILRLEREILELRDVVSIFLPIQRKRR